MLKIIESESSVWTVIAEDGELRIFGREDDGEWSELSLNEESEQIDQDKSMLLEELYQREANADGHERHGPRGEEDEPDEDDEEDQAEEPELEEDEEPDDEEDEAEEPELEEDEEPDEDQVEEEPEPQAKKPRRRRAKTTAKR